MEKKLKKVEFTDELKMKYEVAEELGLIEKVKCFGWGELTAKETGRIGGLMTAKKKSNEKK